MALQTTARGFMGGLLDRWASWFYGLPSETSSYTVTQDIKIPVRDGVELVADLYQPRGSNDATSTSPLLLVHGCYGRGTIMALLNARLFASRGYTVLFVSCRGTFGSGGQFLPGRAEQLDGQDIVVWLREQPWYPGSFATAGSSYLGYSQWALLHDPPVDWAGAVIAAGPHDYARNHWGTGSLRLDRIIWSDVVSHQEDPRFLPLPPMSRLDKDKALGKAVFLGLPLRDSLRAYLDGAAPWVDNALMHPNVDDPYWEVTRHGAALERVGKPVLLISGWYDLFAEQTMDQYRRLRDRGLTVALTVGPWEHLGAAGLTPMPEILQFLGEHVAGRKENCRPDPVRIFVMGSDEWRSMPSWPPPTRPLTWYLQDGKTLTKEALRLDAKPSSFIFNPSDPSPSIGGPLLRGGGRADDSEYATRSDLLVYTSGPLETDIEVLGRPAVELAHSSDTPYADLWVRLSEVDQAGVSHNITERFQTLDPKRDPSKTTQVDMQDCAHCFRKGTCIRLIVAGGCFPQFARNLGVDDDRITGLTAQPACHTLREAYGSSKLILPISG